MKYPEPPLVQNRGAGSHNYLLTLSSASLACDLGENDRTPPVGIPLVDIRKALRTVPVSHMYSTKHCTRVSVSNNYYLQCVLLHPTYAKPVLIRACPVIPSLHLSSPPPTVRPPCAPLPASSPLRYRYRAWIIAKVQVSHGR